MESSQKRGDHKNQLTSVSSQEAQLSANYFSVIVVPSVFTQLSPPSIIADFHPPLPLIATSLESDVTSVVTALFRLCSREAQDIMDALSFLQ